MAQIILISLRMTLVTLVLTAGIYPALVTGLAQLLFPHAANGSLVRDAGGKVVGSELIGQGFKSDGYFQPRPSAAGADGWDAAASSGSNLGPTSKALRDRVQQAVAALRETNPQAAGEIPAELVTASASGLDPHLSPEAAMWQAPRVAAAREVGVERVRSLIEAQVEGRTFGMLGEPRVNVLLLNLALDRQMPLRRG